jgi:putative FmdB family regulatory protein
MPRYEYLCTVCKDQMIIAHLSDEQVVDCPTCKAESTLKKLVSQISTKPKKQDNRKIGHVTEQFIKDTRQELKQQKEEMLKKT